MILEGFEVYLVGMFLILVFGVEIGGFDFFRLVEGCLIGFIEELFFYC